VIDYKSGTSPYSNADLIEGRNVQMLVYVLAAAQALNFERVRGTFWHISNRKTSGHLDITVGDDIETIREAIAKLHQRVIAARQAEFPAVSSRLTRDGKCSIYCEFSRLCRVRTNAIASA